MWNADPDTGAWKFTKIDNNPSSLPFKTHVKIQLSATLKSDQDPDPDPEPHSFGSQDSDPHGDKKAGSECGSTTKRMFQPRPKKIVASQKRVNDLIFIPA
jgi:hypothetical protein